MPKAGSVSLVICEPVLLSCEKEIMLCILMAKSLPHKRLFSDDGRTRLRSTGALQHIIAALHVIALVILLER